MMITTTKTTTSPTAKPTAEVLSKHVNIQWPHFTKMNDYGVAYTRVIHASVFTSLDKQKAVSISNG